MKQIAILGCGPAGMLAYHAAKLAGHAPTLFSRKYKSPMLGAQYLHRAIPELGYIETPSKLAYILLGDAEQYRDKVYKDVEVIVSPQQFAGMHEAWSLRRAYDELWFKYNAAIVDSQIDHAMLQHIVGEYDVVLSTIPAPTLCYQGHHFLSVKVWIDSTWRGEDKLALYGARNVVLCNGTPIDSEHPYQTGWYRSSTIFGHSNTEWSDLVRVSGATRVVKPLATDCNCWPTIFRAGRYGQWQKGVLSHEAFGMTLEALV